MKYFILILSFVLLTTSLSAQDNIETKKYYEYKIEHYKYMRNMGYTLTGFGSVSLITGLLLYNEEQTVIDLDNGFLLASNAFFIAIGLVCVISGTILIINGSRKMKRYSELLERLDLGVNLLNQRKAITLTYRF